MALGGMPAAVTGPMRGVRRGALQCSRAAARKAPTLAAAMKARAIPVFPDVGSTMVVLPGVIRPLFSASVIMALPMRSFTEQQGSMISSLAATRASHLPAAASGLGDRRTRPRPPASQHATAQYGRSTSHPCALQPHPGRTRDALEVHHGRLADEVRNVLRDVHLRKIGSGDGSPDVALRIGGREAQATCGSLRFEARQLR